MTDSSSEEDLSQFKDAIDTTFLNDDMFKNNGKNNQSKVTKPKVLPKSNRYLEEQTHYNDVRVSSELQKQISDKIARIIERDTEFVEVQDKISDLNDDTEGGMFLFRDSTKFLSTEEPKDTYTAEHNKRCKDSMKRVTGYKLINGDSELSDKEKVRLATIDAAFISSRKEVKHWKSRRKEKLYCYKKNKNGVLVSCD